MFLFLRAMSLGLHGFRVILQTEKTFLDNMVKRVSCTQSSLVRATWRNQFDNCNDQRKGLPNHYTFIASNGERPNINAACKSQQGEQNTGYLNII